MPLTCHYFPCSPSLALTCLARRTCLAVTSVAWATVCAPTDAAAAAASFSHCFFFFLSFSFLNMLFQVMTFFCHPRRCSICPTNLSSSAASRCRSGVPSSNSRVAPTRHSPLASFSGEITPGLSQWCRLGTGATCCGHSPWELTTVRAEVLQHQCSQTRPATKILSRSSDTSSPRHHPEAQQQHHQQQQHQQQQWRQQARRAHQRCSLKARRCLWRRASACLWRAHAEQKAPQHQSGGGARLLPRWPTEKTRRWRGSRHVRGQASARSYTVMASSVWTAARLGHGSRVCGQNLASTSGASGKKQKMHRHERCTIHFLRPERLPGVLPRTATIRVLPRWPPQRLLSHRLCNTRLLCLGWLARTTRQSLLRYTLTFGFRLSLRNRAIRTSVRCALRDEASAAQNTNTHTPSHVTCATVAPIVFFRSSLSSLLQYFFRLHCCSLRLFVCAAWCYQP
jgi:hypothetical protein